MVAAAAIEQPHSPDLQLNLLLLLYDQRSQLQLLAENCVRDLLKSLQDYETRLKDLASEHLQRVEATIVTAAAQRASGDSERAEAGDGGDVTAKPQRPTKVVETAQSCCSDFSAAGLPNLLGLEAALRGLEGYRDGTPRLSRASPCSHRAMLSALSLDSSSVGSLELSSDLGGSSRTSSCPLRASSALDAPWDVVPEEREGCSEAGSGPSRGPWMSASDESQNICEGTPVWLRSGQSADGPGDVAGYGQPEELDADLLCSDPLEGAQAEGRDRALARWLSQGQAPCPGLPASAARAGRSTRPGCPS